jgi:hypothetical protein
MKLLFGQPSKGLNRMPVPQEHGTICWPSRKIPEIDRCFLLTSSQRKKLQLSGVKSYYNSYWIDPLVTDTKSAFGIKAPDAPAFEATEIQKGAKYQYIERLAALAYQLGLTDRLPDCRYAVITSRGHLNEDFVYLVDWLAEQRTKHAESTGLRDSVSFPHRKALFRNEVLDRLTIYLLKVNSLWGNLDEAARGNKTLRKNNAGSERARGLPRGRGPGGPGPPPGSRPGTRTTLSAY